MRRTPTTRPRRLVNSNSWLRFYCHAFPLFFRPRPSRQSEQLIDPLKLLFYSMDGPQTTGAAHHGGQQELEQRSAGSIFRRVLDKTLPRANDVRTLRAGPRDGYRWQGVCGEGVGGRERGTARRRYDSETLRVRKAWRQAGRANRLLSIIKCRPHHAAAKAPAGVPHGGRQHGGPHMQAE